MNVRLADCSFAFVEMAVLNERGLRLGECDHDCGLPLRLQNVEGHHNDDCCYDGPVVHNDDLYWLDHHRHCCCCCCLPLVNVAYKPCVHGNVIGPHVGIYYYIAAAAVAVNVADPSGSERAGCAPPGPSSPPTSQNEEVTKTEAIKIRKTNRANGKSNHNVPHLYSHVLHRNR